MNFSDASLLKEELQAKIEYANAESVSLLITSLPQEGSFTAGNFEKEYKVTDIIELEFIVNDDFEFLKWKITDGSENYDWSDHVKVIEERVSEDSKKCYFTFSIEKKGNIKISPYCKKRPQVKGFNPQNIPAGTTKDSVISISFDQSLDISQFRFTQEELDSFSERNSSLDKSDEHGVYAWIDSNGSTFFKNIVIENTDGYSLCGNFHKPF